MKSKILFVAGNISVFDATPIKIYDYLKATSHLLEKPTVVGLLGIRSFFNFKKRKEAEKIFNRAGIRLTYCPRMLPISALWVWIKFKFGRFDKLYVNNLTAGIHGWLLKKLFNVEYVFDFHGAIPEEKVLIGNWTNDSYRYKVMKKMERKIAWDSVANVAISSVALEYLGCTRNKKANLVIPCGINFDPYSISEQSRKELRMKLNIQGKFVVLYSGSISPWNDYDTLINVLRFLRKYEPDFMFLLLSNDKTDVINEFIQKTGLLSNDCIRLSVAHSEIHTYTSCADLALLIRKHSVVNEISSPMKFAEYIGAGVPVLISSRVGDASTEVEQHELGMVIKSSDDTVKLMDFVRSIKENRNCYFERNRRFAANQYRLSAFVEKYHLLYNS